MDRLQVGMWINFTTTAGLPARGQIIRLIYPIYIVVRFKPHGDGKYGIKIILRDDIIEISTQNFDAMVPTAASIDEGCANFSHLSFASSCSNQTEKTSSNLNLNPKIMLPTQSSKTKQSLSNLAVQQSTMIHSQTSKAEKTSSNLSFQQIMVVSSQPIQSEKSFSNLHKYHKIMLSTQLS
jgi:hypothetical protein